MVYKWDHHKNAWLKDNRGVLFEEIMGCVAARKILDIIEHPNQQKYGHQRIMVVELKGYVFHVPYVQMQDGYFLKTIIPSRKSTRKYLGEY
ncbi:MAG: toxin [Candidatus Omnitrophota bacterium]